MAGMITAKSILRASYIVLLLFVSNLAINHSTSGRTIGEDVLANKVARANADPVQETASEDWQINYWTVA